MKKLLKLLNEYGKPSCRGKKREKLDLECADRFYAISKYYGFINWLVDNDKIDLEKLLKAIKENKIYCGKWGKVRNMLLMLLSVEDKPIEFLISILK